MALLHDPQLLVLDEPTVGVDPLLRSRIWEYMRTLADTGVTIIITTHYIEEARMADQIGLFRDGRLHISGLCCNSSRLLEEGNPIHLLEKYHHTSLEVSGHTISFNCCRNFSSPFVKVLIQNLVLFM